jgi:hypothetical protein
MHSTPGFFSLRADLPSPISTFTKATILTGARYDGWSIGGGVEVAILRNLIGRIEYLYDDFGSKDYIGVTGDPYRVHFTGQTLRGVLAWKFDPFGKRAYLP